MASKRREYLLGLQSTKSKSKFLGMGENPAEYLTDPRFSKSQVETLFSLRSRTIQCKDNFKMKFKDNDLLCNCCKLFYCSQGHILQCPEIVKLVKIHTHCEVKDPEMIYGTVDQQLKIVRVYEEYLSIRETLLKESSSTQSD